MAMFEIKCPMCKGTIWIDPSSGDVVDHKPADSGKMDFGDFMKKREGQGAALEEKFRKAKEEKEKRRKRMEQDFKKAGEHPEELKGEFDSPFKWD